MCGIGAFFQPASVAARARVTRTQLQRAMTELTRRGPDARAVQGWDAHGIATSNETQPQHALLHTRLAIIDPRPEADQPFAAADGKVWIAYNGEMYSWQDDAASLARQGHVFRTRSDTEYLLNAYLAYGEACLAPLSGMFSFVIVDWRSRTVFAARDRMGEKPLVYAHGADGTLRLGSTVRTVAHMLPAHKRVIDATSIDAYLAHRTVPAPRTIFRGISRLPAAHCLRYSLDTGALEVRRYWQPSIPAQADASPERFAHTLQTAVQGRMVADRPLALFLSGGIDSTVIAELATRNGQSLTACTAAFAGSPFDESDTAAKIAAHLGLTHQVVPIAFNLTADFSRIVADLDDPFADPGALPLWYLARSTTNSAKVVLTGDGGDELFGGYKRYRAHLRTAWRAPFVASWLPAPPGFVESAWARLAEEFRLPWSDAYALRFSGFVPRERRALATHPEQVAPHYWAAPDLALPAPSLGSLLARDRSNYLPEYALRKGDLATMAHGLEARAPLLDHHVVEAALALPRDAQKPKHHLAALSRTVAQLNLESLPKRGFNPPLVDWLTRDLAAHTRALADTLPQLGTGSIRRAGVEQFAAMFVTNPARHAEKMLQLLMLDESLRQLADLDSVA